MLYDHGKWPNPFVDIDIRPDHASVLERGSIIDVQVAGELKLGVPDFDNSNLGCRYAHDTFHAICNCQPNNSTEVKYMLTFVKSLSQHMHLFEPVHRRLYANVDCSG